MSDVVLAPPDAYDPTKELGFVTAPDQYPVLNFSRFDGGTFFAFRKDTAAFQLSSGLNVLSGLQPFLTTA